MPWDEILKSILTIEGGIHPALFLAVSGCAVWFLLAWRQSEKERRQEYREMVEATSAATALVHAKREEDLKVLTLTIERSSTALTANTVSTESRIQSMNQLTMAFGEMVTRNREWQDHIKDYQRSAEQRQNEILSLLRGR
jgi:hypothetical protein